MSNAPRLRCAIYTRKSTEEGLDQEFMFSCGRHIVDLPESTPIAPRCSVRWPSPARPDLIKALITFSLAAAGLINVLFLDGRPPNLLAINSIYQ